MWDEILLDLGLNDVPLIEELNFPEVGGAGVDDFEIDDSEEMNLENLLNEVDMNELLEFEDINVEEVTNTYNTGNMEEEDYRHEFFKR